MTTSQTQTTIKFLWDHIPNGVINYEVSYTYQGPCSGVDDSGTETVAGPLTQHTLMGLEEFNTYMITVRAVYNGKYTQTLSALQPLPCHQVGKSLYTKPASLNFVFHKD